MRWLRLLMGRRHELRCAHSRIGLARIETGLKPQLSNCLEMMYDLKYYEL